MGKYKVTKKIFKIEKKKIRKVLKNEKKKPPLINRTQNSPKITEHSAERSAERGTFGGTLGVTRYKSNKFLTKSDDYLNEKFKVRGGSTKWPG